MKTVVMQMASRKARRGCDFVTSWSGKLAKKPGFPVGDGRKDPETRKFDLLACSPPYSFCARAFLDRAMREGGEKEQFVRESARQILPRRGTCRKGRFSGFPVRPPITPPATAEPSRHPSDRPPGTTRRGARDAPPTAAPTLAREKTFVQHPTQGDWNHEHHQAELARHSR